MVNKFLLILFVLLSCAHTAGFSEIPIDTPVDGQDRVKDSSGALERLKQMEEVDPKDWGIRNKCISRVRIKSIHFIDDQSAIVDMMGKKKILLTMRRECRDIKREGYITRVRGGTLCAKFDSFEVIDRGLSCAIKSFEPYIEPTTKEDGANS
jgi:hypothetical protein